ncbi:acyltransferase family protein [Luteipulveratus mongoliensis]|uniref:Acyltransferase n=1 Tax=Luteipulveratus mongoliensis TaxID=571913 RepID=A0A0K1JEU6_9MICO|nr:acyltransferase family protein [Luteipulveratus mongoliensis]AKU15232.1 hypothetical protein VV02_04070 [Luteipulveratus mongoliensis]
MTTLVRRVQGSARSDADQHTAAQTGTFRPDIEGLRAIAVGLVMLAHAEVPGLDGGFIGVDVFFVISGFLITGLLYREMRSTRRLSLMRFWARRAKRLLPASAVVLVATALLTLMLVPSTRWSSIGGDLIASALYVVNWRFADQSVQYLATDTAASPVQHYWSLAVEEQFYILWPLLILGCAWFARQFGLRLRTAMISGILLVIVPSLVWSIYDTASSPAPAYFVTPTRLWELGIGALVALFAPFWAKSTRGAATMLAWGGLVTLVLSALTITQQIAWPSSNALMPALATAAVIAGGFRAREEGPLRLLGRPRLQRMGALSYSLYLWHWPLVAIATARWGELAWPVTLLIVIASTGPAWLTYVMLEDPVRRAALLSRLPSVALAVGATCTAVGVTAGVALNSFAQAQIAEASPAEAKGAGAAAAPVAPPTPSSTWTPSFGIPSSKTSATSTAKPSPTGPPPVNAVLARPPAAGSLDLTPTSISPDPLRATTDLPKHACLTSPESTNVRRCELGNRKATTTVALVGDSKSDQWVDAMDRIARVQGWRLDVYTKAGCAFNAETIYRPSQGRYVQCTAWSASVLAQLTGAHRPAAVLVSGQEAYAMPPGGQATRTHMADGYVTQWNRLKAKGIRVVALTDVPTPDASTVDCVSSHRKKPNKCTFVRNAGLGTPALQAATKRAGVPLITLNDWVCPQAACPAVIGNVLVYRSGNHITATYAMTLVEVLRARLVPAFGTLPTPAG